MQCKGNVTLTPTQQRVADELIASVSTAGVSLLRADSGMGKTTVLNWLEGRLGGAVVRAQQFMALLKTRSPVALEETFMEVLEQALQTGELVIVDDLHLVTEVVQGFDYPRANLINAALSVVLAHVEASGKKIVFAATGENEPAPVRSRALVWKMDDLEPEDFAHMARCHMGEACGAIEFEKVHRFAPTLTGYQIKNACLWLAFKKEEPTTEAFIDYLRERNFTSNVDIDEVEAVGWHDLKGVDDVIQELEAKIALPFENDELTARFELKPKRGVLLAGPPGTGKTTIGRALAHRLKGKFFLIDGTVNAGTESFYDRVNTIFEAAKRNSPSVIFIDDADVIFESGNGGLYRYLLTMLDGLESASTQRVCVVITAMDTTMLPPALLRSGRVELWLHTRLPDENARETILREKLRSLPEPISKADPKILARHSGGLSGADLKAAVEEGKLLYAYDLLRGIEGTTAVEDFFLRAFEGCRANRRSYGRRTQQFATAKYGFPTVW